MVVVSLTFTDAEAARIQAAQEHRGITGTNQEHIAVFKLFLLRRARDFVRRAEREIAIIAINVTDIGGT